VAGAARGRVVNSMMRKHLIANVVPVAIQVPHVYWHRPAFASSCGLHEVCVSPPRHHCSAIAGRGSRGKTAILDRSLTALQSSALRCASLCAQLKAQLEAARHALLGDLMAALAALLAENKHEVGLDQTCRSVQSGRTPSASLLGVESSTALVAGAIQRHSNERARTCKISSWWRDMVTLGHWHPLLVLFNICPQP